MKRLAGLLLVGLLLGAPSFADTIGLVDMQQLLSRYDAAKNAEEEFNKKQEAYQKKLDKHQEKIKKAKEKNKKEDYIQELVDQMQEEMGPEQEQLLRYRAQLMGSLRQKVLAVARQVAKDQGVDVIVDKQAVLFGGYDITEFVIDRLNKLDD